MRKMIPILVGMSIAVAGSMLTAAQEMTGPPKVLQITREFIKPGKAGAMHDRSEANFVQAMARAKWPTHYFALNSMSGKSRALYLTGYESFAAWQKDSDAAEKNAALSAEIERASVSDGELLDALDSAVLSYQEDMSYRPVPTLADIRYMEIFVFHVRPGHYKEWTDLVKLVIDGHKKAGTSANWAAYEVEYGGADEYILFSADKDMAEIDSGFAEGKKFREAIGEDGMQKLQELEARCLTSADSELFAMNPKQSYPPDAWVKASPDFWKPRPMAAAKPAEAATKPAEKKTP